MKQLQLGSTTILYEGLQLRAYGTQNPFTARVLAIVFWAWHFTELWDAHDWMYHRYAWFGVALLMAAISWSRAAIARDLDATLICYVIGFLISAAIHIPLTIGFKRQFAIEEAHRRAQIVAFPRRLQ